MVKELIIARNISSAKKLAKNEGYFYIAGGTEINRLNSPIKASKVVSLQNIASLKEINEVVNTVDDKEHKELRIGSMCTFTQCIESDLVPQSLKKALKFNFSYQKRNMATIGGNIASKRDDSYLIPTLSAMNAYIKLYNNKDEVYILDFIRNFKNNDLIEYVSIPMCSRKTVSYRIANTASSHALVTISLGCCQHSGNIKHPISVACIKGYGIVRLKDVEKEIELSNSIVPEKIKDVVLKNKFNFKSDKLYGSADFKKYELAASAFLLAEELKELLIAE